MDKFRCLEAFVAVADAGNFSAASEKLSTSSVMVGKYVRQLETTLGTRLIHRTTRRQYLTETGIEFYKNARAVLEQMKLAERSIENMQAGPRGLLRISAPTTLGGYAIAPLLAVYLDRYTAVNVELVLSNAVVDLVAEGFDIAVRIGDLVDAELVAKPLPPYQMTMCASPSYLQRRGVPQTPADLSEHDCLGHLIWQGQNAWEPDRAGKLAWPTQNRLRANDGHALRRAAVNGAGIILQPDVLLSEDIAAGRLVPILSAHAPVPRPVNLVYLFDHRPRHKLMSLVNFLLSEVAQTGSWPT